MKEEIGYKVIYKKHNKLYSAIICGIITEYFLNKWTIRKQKQGGFAIFDTIENTKKFAIQRNKIYKCKYIKSKTQYLYYYKNNKKIINNGIDELSTGTIVADKVMLLEEINE